MLKSQMCRKIRGIHRIHLMSPRRQLIPRPLEDPYNSKNPGNLAKAVDMTNVECYRCHKKDHYVNKCPESKPKNSKGTFKVRKMEEPVAEKAVEEPKSIRQTRIRFSDLTAEENDPFIRYWINVYGNRGLGHGVDAEGKDVRVFVVTRANFNTMSLHSWMRM